MMTNLERKVILASLITDLNQKSFESLTKVLKWVSEDSNHESIFNKAIDIIKNEYPQTWEWLELTLEKLAC
jgi:hypothetical protein